jgi:hypothetical protein
MGPVNRTLGGGEWLIYGCDDGKTLVVVSEAHNAAAPFYFVLSPQGTSHHLDSEGSGYKRASDAAGDELQRLSPGEIAALVAEARAAGSASPQR